MENSFSCALDFRGVIIELLYGVPSVEYVHTEYTWHDDKLPNRLVAPLHESITVYQVQVVITSRHHFDYGIALKNAHLLPPCPFSTAAK
jgi:hypothetical protein